MTLLFSIGEGNDPVNVISDLLDIEKTPAKPGYKIAPPEPLTLSHCEYRPCPFGKPPSQLHMSSPGSVASQAFEAAMIEACQHRVAIEEVIGDGRDFFAEKRAKSTNKSVMHLQTGGSIEEKIQRLQGNKKKRYDNVQDWKERMLVKEGNLRGRSRSRSREKYENGDEQVPDN